MIENIMSVNSADTARKIGSVKSAERLSDINAKEPEEASENRDEYVPSEEKEPIGLYGVTPDENGEPRISFDKSADNKDEPETVTVNTDKVDCEIKTLRNKALTLRQKLRSFKNAVLASGRFGYAGSLRSFGSEGFLR